MWSLTAGSFAWWPDWHNEDVPQPATIDASFAATWIAQRYAAAGMRRQLTSADVAALLHAAGVDARDDQGASVSADVWKGFRWNL